MNPYLSPTALALYATAALLLMTAIAVIRNRIRARDAEKAEKGKQESTVTHLRQKASELLAVNAASPLATRKRLEQDLEHFCVRVVQLGMESDAFLSVDQRNTMRQIARAARQELDLGENPEPAPSEPILAVIAPTPSEIAEIAHAADLELEGDLTIRSSRPDLAPTEEISEVDEGEDEDTTVHDRNEIAKFVDGAFDRLTDSGEENVFFVDKGAQVAPEQTN